MKTLPLAARLIVAAAAATTTLSLFGTVVSIAEPQRSVLIAKTQRLEKRQAAPIALALASEAPTAKTGK